MKTVILLTGCINPDGMANTYLTDINERHKQYVDAIHYYIKNTDCKIIFCENSNTNISPLFNYTKDRLEILTFSGNKDKLRGKGYGEAEIIGYAIRHSFCLQDSCIIIKITGRLIVNNISKIVKSMKGKHNFVTCFFHSNLSFADSRIFCGTTSFFKEFLKNRDFINESKGVLFEHVLASTILESTHQFIPFSEEPLITGISGSTGERYNKSIPDKRTRIQYQCYIWMQLKHVYKASPYKHLGFWKRILIQYNILRYKVLLMSFDS